MLKIETYQDRDSALSRTENADCLRPVQIRSTADVNSDADGFVWVITDDQGRYLRESGILV